MEAVLQESFLTKTQNDNFFSYLDKGIDDLETGRLHTLEEAVSLVRVRLEGES